MGFYDDLDFLNCGDVKQTSAARNRQPFQNYYGVQFVPSGSIRLQIGDGEVFTARGPVVFFTYPGIPFSYGSLPGEKREHLHICFRGSRAETYAREKLIGSIDNSGGAMPFISIGDSAELRQLFRKALTYLAYPGENGHARAVLALEEILLFISSQADYESMAFPEAEDFLKLTREISADPQREWNFTEEAAARKISEVHFRRLFRKSAGLPPGQFLLECRMRLARNLLANTSMRIGEIAAETGFNDMFHFSRIFKKRFGKSPVAYRKKYGL